MSLQNIIAARIIADGPMSIADYMAECLFNPTLGYYTTQEPFGVSGDFITAPEISQMFGELIGLALAQAWMDQGKPAEFTLAELGPGRGTLMADVLRATATVPGFSAAANIVLVDASPRLQDIQRQTLGSASVTFAHNVDALPQQPLYLIANEFFDALPVRQFVRGTRHWRERQVGVDGSDLIFGLAPETPYPPLDHRKDDSSPGDMVEIAPQAAHICDAITTLIAACGGAALII
ncbi:MAG: SAM-dependent methyltransferase, partial [Roseobacter sp.]|nr:SAM-dependent methyltransferase [Roseobacter sp.]